jgi:hypothetical protein
VKRAESSKTFSNNVEMGGLPGLICVVTNGESSDSDAPATPGFFALECCLLLLCVCFEPGCCGDDVPAFMATVVETTWDVE